MNIKTKIQTMQTLRIWKNYLVENYHTFASEVAQLGSDAKAEAANIIRDISRNLIINHKKKLLTFKIN